MALLEVEDVHWAKGSLETGWAVAGGGAEEPPSKSPTTGAGAGAAAAGVGAGAAGVDVWAPPANQDLKSEFVCVIISVIAWKSKKRNNFAQV